MSEQVIETVEETKIEASHFQRKYDLSAHRLDEISAIITRHENGQQKLTKEEIDWCKDEYDKFMADVVNRNSNENQTIQRKSALENLEKLNKMDHSKKRHSMTMFGKNKYKYLPQPNPEKSTYDQSRMRATEEIINSYKNADGSDHNYTIHKDIILGEQPGVFTAFCHTELVDGKLEWYYKADSWNEHIYATTPHAHKRVSIRDNDFYSFEEIIGRRWIKNGVPYFHLYPEKSIESALTGGDVWSLRQKCFDHYPDTTQLIPGFLINWTKDMQRTGSDNELPKYYFDKVAHGGFTTLEYLPDLVKRGSTPKQTVNNVEYHIIKIDGKHFIYLIQSIEPATSVMIYIPDNILGLMDNGEELYYALTHPPQIDQTKPYFRQGEWYFVPTDKKTRELIKPTEPPKDKGGITGDGRARTKWYEIEVDSSHVVGEYRFDEQGNSYVRSTVYHMQGDHPALRLGRKVWHKIYRSDAKGHSADLRGATVRYD
ncbi:hypothetical protein LCGC14_0267810 [marine sediment metagenome]|uniref:Uncharacterized protein n=1 Tax=marine sediment metagenome TaxID=412755 RepID=A0A0F9U047_9ZZZZ